MKAYWITRCHVHNLDEYAEYIKLAGPAINKHGGIFLVRGGDQIELEGGPYERTVLIEFNSMDEAKLCYESYEYQEALKHSLNSSNRHVVLVEGVN
ncbi:DUF1330 domain-containing protein [Gammaproteobacteria bacterium]|nr:DUF1330 domain-containing protein [Gammaproteobacteria bacterium]MDA9204837.1 DUF1330 domain-containing protein [Gammaproteobacteria bacterium]MDA9800625.1 DUF1330 domain-containing protein [Gammaproteobacteria bacterium]